MKSVTNASDAIIEVKSGNIKLETGANLSNSGAITAESGSSFSGSGEIQNKSGGTITTKGATFENKVVNEKDGTITAESGTNDFKGTLENNGILTAKENSSISGDIKNEAVTGGSQTDTTNKLTAEGATFNGKVTNGAYRVIELTKGDNTFNDLVKNEANGEITVGTSDSKVSVEIEKELQNSGTLTIESGSSFSGAGVISNKASATITTKGATFGNKVSNEASGIITATGDNAFNGGLENAGTLSADATSENVTISGKIENTSDTAKITATGGTVGATDSKLLTFKNGAEITKGEITVTGNVDFTPGITIGSEGTLTAGEDKATTATTIGGTITNSGTITATGSATDDTKKLTFKDRVTNTATDSGKGITATGKVDFNGGLENSGNFTAGDGKTATTIGGSGEIQNKSGGVIEAKGATFGNKVSNEANGTITATGDNAFNGGLENAGTFTADNSKGTAKQTISGNITNSGKIEAKGGSADDKKLTFNGRVTNTATETDKGITATGNVDFNGGLDNAGIFNAESGSTIGGAITNQNGGTLNAKGATFSNAVTNNEGGTITATGTNDFKQSLTNSGELNVESGKTTLSEGATNSGTLTNKGEVEIGANQNLENTGTIEANGKFRGADGKITNKGKINANGAIFEGSVTTEANSTINASGDNTFSKALENVSGAIFNLNSGTSTFNADLTNKGTLNAESGSVFDGTGTITNNDDSAQITAKGATFKSAVTNTNGKITIESGNNTFEKKVTNAKDKIFEVQSGNVTIEDSTDGFVNQGKLTAKNGTSFSGAGKIANSGTINAEGATFDLSVTTADKSKINASGKNTFTKAFENVENATLTNNGELIFKDAFTNKGGAFNNNGEVTFESSAGFYSDKAGSTATDYTNSNIMTFKGDVSVANFTNTNQGEVNFNNASESGATFNGALTNYGNAFVFGSGKTTFNEAITNGGKLEAISAIEAKKAFNNTGNLNLIGSNAVLTLTDAFTNNGKVIFSFLNGGVGQIDASNNGVTFTNTENKGKVEVNLAGMGKKLGEFEIIKDKTDATSEDSQITLKDSDISFVGGAGTYLGNGKILISEVFPVIPDGTINTPIIATQRANAASMNNMFLASNAILSGNFYNAKYGVRMANRSNNNGFKVALNGLKSNESFYYDSKRMLVADARGSAKSNAREVQGYEVSSAQSGSQSAKKDNFYFLLTPFVNHTSFKEMGGVKVSGLDYGFVTAFGGKVADDNTLGVHFVFDYAKLKGGNEDITNTNLMIGLNYRLDLIYEMYLKARGDFYYFMNQASGAKPNNLGGGVNVAFGKDFVDWKNAGVLGIELGIDYKALNTGKVTTETIFGGSNPNDEYKGALHHLLFVDLGLNYHKYFATNVGLWGFDAGIGGRANLTKQLANTLLVGNRSVDITLDNDRFLGYVSVGGSYVLEAQNYDMEFTLRYNGSFGDKTISNGGSFEWRTKW